MHLVSILAGSLRLLTLLCHKNHLRLHGFKMFAKLTGTNCFLSFSQLLLHLTPHVLSQPVFLIVNALSCRVPYMPLVICMFTVIF